MEKRIIAVNSNCYHGYSIEQALEGIAAAGFHYVELTATKGWTEHVFPDQSFEKLCGVKDLLEKLDLHPFSMSGHCNLMDTQRLPDFVMNMRLAHFFGCDYIVSSIGEAHLADNAKASNELLAQNILFELGEVQQEDKRAGRRKILLGINYAYRHVLSISIEAPATSVTLCDLRGEHGITRRIPTDTSVEPEVFLKRVANVGKALLWENSIGREELLGAGVSVPGPVDREKGVSTHAYRVWDQPVQVTAPLAEALECTVLLENNVKAFAQAELTYGLGRTEENLLLL